MLFRTISEITFLSTPSARRATWGFYALLYTGLISIHALRKEGDDDIAVFCERLRISIHALRKEGDRGDKLHPGIKLVFLSTPSARRATLFLVCAALHHLDFYPRPPQGGRPPRSTLRSGGHIISIHALRKEGDGFNFFSVLRIVHFYPRPPQGGRPLYVPNSTMRQRISIHALRKEGDCRHEYIRGNDRRFLSTPSARRATQLLPLHGKRL